MRSHRAHTKSSLSTGSKYPVQPRHCRRHRGLLLGLLSPSQQGAAGAPRGRGTVREAAKSQVRWRRRPQRGKAGNGRRGARTRHRHPARRFQSTKRREGENRVKWCAWRRSRDQTEDGCAARRRSCGRGGRGGGHCWVGLGMRRGRRGDGTAPVGLRLMAQLAASSRVWWFPLAASLAAAVVRVWGGDGRLWITGGAPCLPFVRASTLLLLRFLFLFFGQTVKVHLFGSI